MIDYQAAAESIGVDVPAVKAIAEVESSGATFWIVGGQKKPPLRLEAHWFGKLTGYRFNESHPHISCRAWTPQLAARNQGEAWQQFEEAAALDESAAIQATSWGFPQIMGFHWKTLGYESPQALREAADTEQGQLDMFLRFIQANPAILDALKRHDWYTFALLYNGRGQVDYYAGKIAEAYERHSR